MDYNGFLDTDFEDTIYRFTVRVKKVDWDVTEEAFWDIDDPELIDDMIRKTKKELPQRFDLELECTEADLEDQIANTISEQTG